MHSNVKITLSINTQRTMRRREVMAYDNFENTPFDLNHDGHIDSNEAAYIYDTFYKELDEPSSEADFGDSGSGDGGSWNPTAEERKKLNDDMEDLRRRVKENAWRRRLTVFGIWIALAVFIPNKLLAALLIVVVEVISSMFE